MNWFKDDRSACSLIEVERGPAPEDDDGDDDDSGSNRFY